MYRKNSPPPPVQIVTGSDGKKRTIVAPPAPTPEQLAEAHRQTMDRISGNERFHEDPFATPAPEKLGKLVQCPFCGVERFGEGWHCDEPPSTVCPKWGSQEV